MRVCSDPECAHGNDPQPDDNFYKSKYRCKVCIHRDGRSRWALEKARRRKLAASPIAVEREGHPCVPLEPWSSWLIGFQQRSGMTIKEMITLLGTSERRLFGWMRMEGDRVYLDVVDKCLCNAHMPEVLRDLYPDLYRFDEEEMAA